MRCSPMHHFFHHKHRSSQKNSTPPKLSTLHDAILLITPSIVRPEYEMDWNDDDPFDWTMITVDESESFVQTFLKKIPYIFKE